MARGEYIYVETARGEWVGLIMFIIIILDEFPYRTSIYHKNNINSLVLTLILRQDIAYKKISKKSEYK